MGFQMQDRVTETLGAPHGARPASADPGMDKIFLVVRSRLFGEGLRRMLHEAGFDVVGGASTGEEISALHEVPDADRIRLAVVEASFCAGHNDLLGSIRRMFPNASIVLLAGEDDLHKLDLKNVELVQAIFSSEMPVKLLLQLLSATPVPQCIVPIDFIRSLLARRAENANGLDIASMAEEQLPSPRETEILRCLIDGCSNKIIARQLGITEATVKVHLKGLLRKIRAANRTQAAIWALNNGISGGVELGSFRLNKSKMSRGRFLSRIR